MFTSFSVNGHGNVLAVGSRKYPGWPEFVRYKQIKCNNICKCFSLSDCPYQSLSWALSSAANISQVALPAQCSQLCGGGGGIKCAYI